ncbi:low-complexity tail membrane protein [Halomicronema sp. CCY15110]|uniref:low-complexity tail membrane protein n=1 Tax=Halomicronema sp. CCY15110 TaxID=2767773 RepID=UPI0019518BD4|nr:low-complexity tail membrane protein [Halomicronema sp. CCY15110]
MSSHRRDPYLWLHLAGLATVPLWLDVCLAGLAIGEPIAPPWLEITTLTLIGTLPILWLQLRRPVYVFGVPGLALRPDRLSEERRRLLTLQRSWWSRGLLLLTAIALWGVLYRLYQMAPMAIDLPGLAGQSRATGWAICAGAFGLANLFALVPATVVPLLLASPRQLENTTPFEVSHILSKFLVLGLRLSRILPEVGPAAESSDSESIAPSLKADAGSGDMQSFLLGTDEVAEAPPEEPDSAESRESFSTVSSHKLSRYAHHTGSSSDAEEDSITHTAAAESRDGMDDDSQLVDIPTTAAIAYSPALPYSHSADAIARLEEPTQLEAPLQNAEAIHTDADIAEERTDALDESELVTPPGNSNCASEQSMNGWHSVHSGLDPS